MSTGDSSFGLVLGLDVDKTKENINRELKAIISQINTSKADGMEVVVGLSKELSKQKITSDVNSVVENINKKSPFQIVLRLDSKQTKDNFVAEINQIIQKISKDSLNGITLNLNNASTINSKSTSSNSQQTTGTSQIANTYIEQLQQYKNKLENITQQITERGIGQRTVTNAISNQAVTINDYIKQLKTQINQISTPNQENLKTWNDSFKTLETGISRVNAELRQLDNAKYLVKFQTEWANLSQQIAQTMNLPSDWTQKFNSAFNIAQGLNNKSESKAFQDSKKELTKLKQEYDSFVQSQSTAQNLSKSEIALKQKQITYYKKLQTEIQTSANISKSLKDNLNQQITALNNTTTSANLQQTIESLKQIETDIRKVHKADTESLTVETWEQKNNAILKLKTTLESLGLTGNSVYANVLNLLNELQKISKIDTVGLKGWTAQFKTTESEVSRLKVSLSAVFDKQKKFTQLTKAKGFYSNLKNSVAVSGGDKTLQRLLEQTQLVLRNLGGAKSNSVVSEQAEVLKNLISQYNSLHQASKFTLNTQMLQSQTEAFANLYKQINESSFASDNLREKIQSLNSVLAGIKAPSQLSEFNKSLMQLNTQWQAEQFIQNVVKFQHGIENTENVSAKFKQQIHSFVSDLKGLFSSNAFDAILNKTKEFEKIQQYMKPIELSKATALNKRFTQQSQQVLTSYGFDYGLQGRVQNAEKLVRALTDQTNKSTYLSPEIYRQAQQELDILDAQIKVLDRDWKQFVDTSKEIQQFNSQIQKANLNTEYWQSTINKLVLNLQASFENPHERSTLLNDVITDLINKQQEFQSLTKKSEEQLKTFYTQIYNSTANPYQAQFNSTQLRIQSIGAQIKSNPELSPQIGKSYETVTEQAKQLTSSYNKLATQFNTVKEAIRGSDGDFHKLSEEQKTLLRNLQPVITEFNKFNSAIKSLLSSVSNLFPKNQETDKPLNDLRELQQTIMRFGSSNNRLFNNTFFRGQFLSLSDDISRALSEVASGQKISTQQVEDFTNRWRHLRNEITRTGSTGLTIGSKLASQFSKLGVYFSAATVFMRIRSSLRNMYENVKEVDNAMTSLKRVTKETHSTYQGFLDDSIVRAKKLGATLSDTISATADFTRLGYSIKEATALSTSALTYQQVGDEVEDINTATSSIVSTMKAFGIQAQDSMMIVDRFNEVANNFSITAGGIGEALQNSASSLSAANNTLEESLGLIIAGNDVVQNPNEVGTALKTLTMRLRNAKADLSELGEDTDGMADSVSKLRGQIKALSGVDIMSSKDEFKSTYQILQELSKVWGTLTDVNQASLTELIAGKRQGNLMSSIMKNFQDAESVVRVANRSAGSAETEHEKKLQSINGKLSILQSTYQELSDTVMEDGLVKNAIKQLTNLLEIINRLVKSSGSLRTAISLIATALLSFNNKGLFTRNSLGQMGFAWTNHKKSIQGEKDSIDNALKTIFDEETNQQSWAYYASTKKLAEGTSEYNEARATFIKDRLKEYNAELTKGIVNTENLKQAQAKLANNASFLSAAFTKLKGVVKGLGNIVLSAVNIFVNMALSMAVSAFLGAIISLFQKTTKAIEGANQATQDFISRAKDLSNIQESIVSLKEKLADKNITEEESLSIRKQLYELQENMIDRYGSEAQGIDLVRDSVDALNNSFNELRKKELQNLYLNNVTGYQKSLASLYGEDSIRSWGWNTGNERIKLEYGFKDDVLKQLSSVLGEDYVRGGTEDFRTLYLDIGKFIKDNGGTKVDLVAKYDEVILALDAVAKDYKEKSYDDSEIQTVIRYLGSAKKYWTGGTYKEELENTQTYAEYLVLDDAQYNKAYTALKKARNDYNNAIASGNQKLIWDTASHYLTAQQDVQKIIEELGEYDEEGAVKDFLQNFVDKADNELAQHKFELKIQADENQLKTTLDKALIQFANGKKIFADDIINFNPNADINKNNTQIVTAFQDISKQAEEAGVSLQTFVSWLVELGMVESDTATKKTYNFVKMLDMTSESMSAITTKIDEVQKAFTTVKEVIEDYEDKKILTIDSAQKLIDLGDKYIQYLFDENGHLEVNEEAYEKLTKAKIESLKAELLHNAIDNIKQIKTEADAVEYLKDKVTEETEATNEYNTALLQRLYLEGISNKNTKVQQAVQYIYDTYTNYSRILDNVNTEYKANEMASTSVTKGLNEQKNALEKQKRVLDKSKDSLDKNKTALERNKTALEESNSELEKNKGYIEDLISLTVDMLKKKYEEEKEVIEKTKEAYKEKVDALKESLDKEKEAYDRHESYFKQNQDIATLEKQASALSGTKSVEGIQRLSEIQKELSEKKQSLYDTQYSDSISDRKEALDKEYEYREKIWDKEINRIDELLKNERQLRIQAMELIDSKTQQFYNNLWEYVYKYTTKSRYEFDNLWNNAYRALEKYGFGQLTCLKIMDLLERQIYENQQAVDGLDRQIKILNKSIDGTSDSINGVSKEIENLDNKINELTKSYETATKTKETFETAKQASGFQATLGGNTYLSATTDPNKASADILSQYNDYLNTYAKGAPYHRYSLEEVQKQMSAYASGTLASKGGLAVVDEDGLNSEWILKKGRVDYLPENSVVFNKSETQALKFLAQSSDKVKKIISNPDYLSYFNSHLNQENVSSRMVNGVKSWYQNINANQQKTFNMPLTINISNSQQLNERQLANRIKDDVFHELNKYGAWNG